MIPLLCIQRERPKAVLYAHKGRGENLDLDALQAVLLLQLDQVAVEVWVCLKEEQF